MPFVVADGLLYAKITGDKYSEVGEAKKYYDPSVILDPNEGLANLLTNAALDPFGKTEERKMERALIVEYRASIEEILKSLNARNLALAVDIARIPEDIRGFGHVKENHLAAARTKWQNLMQRWNAPQAASAQPEQPAAAVN